MADPDETEVDEEQPPKKNWRRELEDRAETAETQLVEATTRLAFYDADLGHLSDEQRSDVLTLAKAKGQTSAEDLKAIADRLSYTRPVPASGEVPPVQEATVEDPARTAELSELARLAAGAPGPGSPQAAALDLSEYTDNDSLKAYLMGQIDDSFGPTLE